MRKPRVVTAALAAAVALIATTSFAQAPQLLRRELDPNWKGGAEKGGRPFQWAKIHTESGIPYLFVGRGNAFDMWNVTSPLSAALTRSYVGQPSGQVLQEPGDEDYHLRSAAILDDEPEMFGAYYNLGSYAFTLNPVSSSVPVTIVKEYPTYTIDPGTGAWQLPAFSEYVTGVASFRDAAGARYLVGRFLLRDGYASGLYATGIYDYSNPAAISRVRSLPFRASSNDTTCPGCPVDEAALQSQGFMTFRAKGRPFVAVPGGSPSGTLHLLDVSSVPAITSQQINPPSGYNALTAKAYDPQRELLMLAYSGNGLPPLVVLYEMRSVIGVVTPVELLRGTVPGLSSVVSGAVGAGVVAVSGVVPGTSPERRTTYLGAIDGVTGTLVWKTDSALLTCSNFFEQSGATPCTPASPNDLYYRYIAATSVLLDAGTDIVLYRGGVDMAEWWRVPKALVDPAPHAGFSVTSSSTGASCATTPTSPSSAVAAQGFPGATMTITNQSSGVVTASSLEIVRVSPSPAVIYAEAPLALGASYAWATGTGADPGEYHVTVNAEDSGSGKSETLVKSVFLCNEGAALAAPTATSVLLAETLLADARDSQGTPNGYDFVVVPPGGPTAFTPVVPAVGTRTVTFSQCGAHSVGVVAHYDHSGTDTTCAGKAWYTDANPATYDACTEWPAITAGLSAVAFYLRQAGSVVATAPGATSTSAVRSVDTVLDAGATRVAAGYTPSYQWLIGGVPACQSPYKPAAGCSDTQATYTIPANAMSVGTPVNVSLQVTLAGPGVAGCDLAPDAVALTVNPTEVTADVAVNPSTANVGQQVTFTLSSVTGSFSTLSVDLGGATTCGGQTSVALCTGTQCVVGRQVQATVQSPGTWQVKLVGTPSLGGSFTGPTHPLTVNNTGSCTQSMNLQASPNPANAGQTVTISFSPPVVSGNDQLTINFGDGSQVVLGSFCAMFGGCSSTTHQYQSTGSFSISAAGTISGVNYVGSTTLTVSGTTPPPTSNLTMSAAPNPVNQGALTTITFSPALTTSGESLTFNFGDGSSTTLSHPACSGSIFGGSGPCSTVTHVYQSPGTFTVTASGTVSGASRSGSTQVTVASLCTLPSAPVADFTWAPTIGKVNQPVQFSNLSTGGPTSFAWDFGDGVAPLIPSGSSGAQSPAYTFTREGTFTVKLTAANCRGSSQVTHPVTIGPECELAEAPVAKFRLDTAEPRAKQAVQFTDESTGTIAGWLWDFGDGQTSSAQSPSHVYQQPGNYIVKLTASNCKGPSTFELPVTVGEDNRPVVADFSWQPSALTTGEEITFTAATGTDYGDPEAFTWQFSDATGSLTGAEVARTFACSGTVQVTLTAVRGSFSDTESKTLGIDGERCSPEAVVTTDAAKTAGANGTYWQTDLWVFNPSVQATQVWLAVLSSGADNATPLTSGPYTVGPRATLYLHNVLEELSQQTGQDYRKGSIRLTFENSEDVAPVATARTFTPSPSLPGGNYGQSVRGVPVWPNSTAPVQWLTGLRNDGSESGFRTNFGLANLRGDRSADPVVVTLFGSSGSQLGQKTFGLPPYGYIQDSIANLFGVGSSTIGPFSLKIEVGKQADVEINASVVENLTGDPMQVVAAVPQQTSLYLPAIARAAGANDTVWRSSLQLTNPYDAPRTWRLTYQPRGEGQAGVSRDLTLAAGQTFAIEDAVAWVFAAFGVSPPEQTAGVVKITPMAGSVDAPIAVARTYNVTIQGTFGHAIPALHAAMGASAGGGSTFLILPGLSSEDVARTNLGFVNLTENGSVNFDAYFFAEDGTLLNPEGKPYVLALPPGGWDQDRIENRFRGYFGAELPANQRALTVAVQVRSGTGGFAYASVVDNVTGDPIWVSGQLQP